MIADQIQNIDRYGIPYKDKIKAYLQARDPRYIEDGEHEIDGRNLFVRVMSHVPKPAEENKFEAHRVYADLQYVAEGIELMQTAPQDQLKPITEYDAQGDYQFYKVGHFINDHVVRAGEFTVFFPGEAHRPSCLVKGHQGKVKKLVFKIKIQVYG